MKMDVIRFLKEIPENNPDRIFLIDSISNNILTYKDLHNSACKVGAFLLSLGLERGDRVAILMDNSVSILKLYFGCLYNAIVVVPINPASSENQINFTIINSKVKAVFTSPELLSRIERSELLFKDDKKIIPVTDSVNCNKEKAVDDNVINFSELKLNDRYIPFKDVTENDNLIIVYTSGTTSEPKGVVHNISNMINNGRLFSQRLSIGEQNRFYNILPMTYLGGYYNLLLIPYISGSSVVLANAFDAKSAIDFWGPIREYQVNTLWFVPTIMSIIMKMDRSQEGVTYCREHEIRALVGMDYLPDKLGCEFESRYGLKLLENYGLSETFFITTQIPGNDTPKISVGKPLPGVEIKTVDKDLREVPYGSEGEILVNTPFLMEGYYNAEDGKPDAISPDGWFPTGDLGILNDQGELSITGRKKDLIIKGGINISPISIEKIICENPLVEGCAVVGVPHEVIGEEIVVVIRLKPNIEFSIVKEDLIKLCKEKLSVVQQPSHYFELEELPRTSSGKVQKVKVRAWLKEQLKNNQYLGTQISRQKHIDGKIDKEYYFKASRVVAESIEAISIKYNTMVYEMQRKNVDVTVLSLGEAFFNLPKLTFDDLPFPQIYHYSHPRGIPELRDNITKYFLEEYDVSFNPDTEIIVTAGSKIAIYMALMAILNPGDEAIIPEPAWVSYPEQVKLCYGVPVQIPYNVEVFDYERYITNRTKVIIINNPHNPTGKIYSLPELSYLCKLAEKYNLFVLSDEAYSDFLLDEDQFVSIGNLDRDKERTIICNSISKNYGISGWRLGYVITNVSLINQILKVNQHLITCPATILQYCVAKHFFEIIEVTKPQIIELVNKRKEIAVYMDKIGLGYLPGTATFYFFVSIEGSSLTSEEFCTKLIDDKHISTVPGIGYGKSCDKFIRVSVGTESIARIFRGLDIIKDLVTNT
jgi:aminotransferase